MNRCVAERNEKAGEWKCQNTRGEHANVIALYKTCMLHSLTDSHTHTCNVRSTIGEQTKMNVSESGEPGLCGPMEFSEFSHELCGIPNGRCSLEFRSVQSNIAVEMNVWQFLLKNVCEIRRIDKTVIALATKE